MSVVAQTPHPEPSPGPIIGPARAWSVVAMLTLLYGVGTLDRQMISLLVTPLKEDLALTDVEIGLLQGAAFALFFVIASLPIGWLVDRASRRLILFWGTLCWSIAAAGSGLASNFGQLFTMRAGVGVGEATLQPSAFAIMPDLFRADRLAFPLSVFVIGASAGSGVSLILGGVLVDWASEVSVHIPGFGEISSWRLAFVVTGLPGLLLAFGALTIPESRASGWKTETRGSMRELGRQYRRHLGFYVSHNLAFAMCLAFFIGLLAWNPAYMQRQFGWGLTSIGLWLGCSQIVSAVIGLLFHGWAVDRLFRGGMEDAHMRYHAWLAPLAAGFAACAYLVPNPWLMILFFNLGLFCIMGYPGIGAAALQIATPAPMRGKASAIYLIGLNLIGAMLGPLVIAAITQYAFSDEARLGEAMAIFAVMAMGIATVLFALGRGPMRRAVRANAGP